MGDNLTWDFIIPHIRVAGCRKAEIGFIGIEPGKGYIEWCLESQQNSIFPTPESFEVEAQNKKTFYAKVTTLLRAIYGQNEAVHGNSKKSFQVNLFPLNCPGADDFPLEYRLALKVTKAKYREACRAYRYPLLYNFLNKDNFPNLRCIICCGHRPEFLKLFKLKNKTDNNQDILTLPILLHGREITLFLVPFFNNWNKWTDERIKDFADEVKAVLENKQ